MFAAIGLSALALTACSAPLVSGRGDAAGVIAGGPFRFVVPPSLPISSVTVPSSQEPGAVQPLTVPALAPASTTARDTVQAQAATQTQARAQAKACPFGR